MKIGISGAQSVGKTTLLNALRSEEVFKDFVICNEVTRRVKSYGFTINENGDEITQRLIMQEHIVNVFMNDKMITDRTVLDGLVYTQYLCEEKGVSMEQAYRYSRKVYDRLIGKYDLLFYIDPEFNLVSDGTRSENIFFRDRIVTIFNSIIEKEKLPVIRLSGSVRERTLQVIEAYKHKEAEYIVQMENACDY